MSTITRHEAPNRFHELKEALLMLAATGASKSIIAEKAGLDRSTLNDWLTNADEWPEVAEWKRQFEAARADAHLRSHTEIAASPKTEDHRWLLERMRPDEYGARHDGFGPRPSDMAKPLTPAQEDHRMIQMLAHPTKRMRKCLAEALRKAGPGLTQVLDEYLRTRPLVVEGVEVPVAQLGSPVPQTDLEERKLAFQALLAAHPRVALGGCSKAGKTTVFAPLCIDRPIVHTDDFIEDMTGRTTAERAKIWKEAADKALVQCAGMPAFLLEGVRATGVIRAGLEVDVLVWVGTPLVELTKQQEVQRKGRETTLDKLMAEMPQLKVVRI